MDPPRPPHRLLDEVERARQSALGRYRGSLSRRMPTSPAWRGMPSYRPPAPVPDPVRRAYERAWSDVPDPDEDAYAAGVAWGSAAAYGDLDASPPCAAAPPGEQEEDDDDFDWSDDGEEGCGAQIQEAMEASFQSVRDDCVQRARTACQLKAKEASELAWALKDSSSVARALRRKRARENQAAANGAGSSRRSLQGRRYLQAIRKCTCGGGGSGDGGSGRGGGGGGSTKWAIYRVVWLTKWS